MQTSITGFGDVPAMRKDLNAKLLPHQKQRVEAAIKRERLLIADETGIGKTASALAAMEEAQAFPAVIVTPATARDSILAECRKWLPWRSSAILESGAPTAEILILHPEVLVQHRMALLRVGPKALVLDESHYYKSHASERGRAARELAGRCPMRILLSATPIKNLRDDLVHQLELLGRTREVLEKAYGHARLKVPDLSTRLDVLAALRRVPREALHWALGEVVMLRTTHGRERTGLGKVKRHQLECAGADTEEYRRLEEQFIAYCKQMALLKKDAKAERARARIRASSMLNGMRAVLGAAKVATTRTWATKLRAEGRKGVVFCYHREVATILAAQLPGRVLVITGDTPLARRQETVAQMARADFLVATMDAMAHGVNGLQHHARDLAFVELDYTHSKHEQSEGRLRRHGQKGQVNAYYLVAPGTYDEALLATLRKKWKDANGILDGREGARKGNFAEEVLSSIIAQRPWESGGRVDWRAAARTFTKGASVTKPGKNGLLHGRVLWANQASCRVEWDGGLVTFEVADGLSAAPATA